MVDERIAPPPPSQPLPLHPTQPRPRQTPTHSHTPVLDGLSAADQEPRADNAPSPSYGKRRAFPTHRRPGLW
jgi:hypothetical protein